MTTQTAIKQPECSPELSKKRPWTLTITSTLPEFSTQVQSWAADVWDRGKNVQVVHDRVLLAEEEEGREDHHAHHHEEDHELQRLVPEDRAVAAAYDAGICREVIELFL